MQTYYRLNTNPMKLAVVTNFTPSKSNVSEYGYHLAKNFAKNQDVSELIVFTENSIDQTNTNDYSKINGCTVKINECLDRKTTKNAFSILKAVKEEKPDAILFNLHSTQPNSNSLMSVLLPLVLKLKGISTIVLLHQVKTEGFLNKTFTRLLLQADLVTVTLEEQARLLRENFNAHNVSVVRHGSFSTPVFPQPVKKDEPKKVLAFGKFGTYKRVEILIEAIEQVRKRTEQKIELIIAGTDAPEAQGYLDKVKKSYHDVEDIFFTGYVEENDVKHVFKESTIVAFPYTSLEGNAGILHQAGAYGKATVLPQTKDFEIISQEEGYTGAFFNERSISSLATAIESLIVNDEYRTEVAETNYQAACKNTLASVTSSYITLFKNIIDNKYSYALV